MKPLTIQLIRKGHKYSAHYSGGLSSHLPMALFALDALGASDAHVEQFYNRYSKKLVFAKEGDASLENWQSCLGKERLFPELVSYFQETIRNHGVVSVVKSCSPILAPGISGGAYPLSSLSICSGNR